MSILSVLGALGGSGPEFGKECLWRQSNWGRERKVRRSRSVVSTEDDSGWGRRQGNLLRMFCCRTRDETVELVLEEQREKRRPKSSLGFLIGQVTKFLRM